VLIVGPRVFAFGTHKSRCLVQLVQCFGTPRVLGTYFRTSLRYPVRADFRHTLSTDIPSVVFPITS